MKPNREIDAEMRLKVIGGVTAGRAHEGMNGHAGKGSEDEPKPNGHASDGHPDISSLSAASWIKRDIPPEDLLLGNVFSTTRRILLAAATGIGKTMLALGIAFAVRLGQGFLHWCGHGKARRVFFVDGEIRGHTRAAAAPAGLAAANCSCQLTPGCGMAWNGPASSSHQTARPSWLPSV